MTTGGHSSGRIERRRQPRVFALLALLAFAPGVDLSAEELDRYPDFHFEEPIVVRPVLFLPRESRLASDEAARSGELLLRHLAVAREHYRAILVTSTFAVALGRPEVFQSAEPDAFFAGLGPEDRPDSAHRILREILQARGEDRYSARSVFLVVYVRPGGGPAGVRNQFGGGRSINGSPGSGGGYVEMEYSSLLRDAPYPFQSTLVHELGHAFGLTHSTIFGQPLESGSSIMSYNQRHWSKGLQQSDDPGTLMPEEILVLAGNRAIFPGLVFDPGLHGTPVLGPEAWNQGILAPMDESIGAFRAVAGVGYELTWDGRRVNGPESAFYTRLQAEQNLAWNRWAHEGIEVEGSYNGKPMP